MAKETLLYDFQQRILNQSKPNYIIAADTGTGKTMMGIHHYLKYREDEPLLVVAPPSKIKEGGWDREIEFIANHYEVDIEYALLSWGSVAKNWAKFKGYYVLFDECHMAKNSTSQRGKAAFKLAEYSTHFCLLSATTMPNGWGDAINYFKMFGFTKNKTQFNHEFAIMEYQKFGAQQFQKVVGYRNEDELEKMYQSVSVTISKNEALDLPDITYQFINFKPSKEYRVIKKDRVLDDVDYDSSAKLLSGLRYYANQKDKLAYTKDFLEGTSRNVVIFYNFKQEVEDLLDIAKKLDKKIYQVSGGKFSLPDKTDWPDVTNSVTFVQYQAGSAGIELQYCSEVIYYTPTYSYGDYQQSLGRAYRNGQENKVSVYQYKTLGTVEEEVWKALENKEDFDMKLYELTKLGG